MPLRHLSHKFSAPGEIVYDAFISYSHAKDRAIASALQSTIQKLGKPWYRRRALRVFRDDTSLSATPQLWPSIEVALNRARFLVLLASPEAAASLWVDKEATWWVEHKSIETLLIGLTDGALEWNGTTRDFQRCKSSPLPPALRGSFAVEPRWTDLRPYRASASLKDPRFVELGADFAATIRGVPKEDLLSQEVRQQRRALRLAISAASALAILLVAASWLWIVAEKQKNQIRAQRDRAEQALVSATDTILELAKTYRNVETAPGAMTDIIVKIRKLQEQLSADVELDAGMQLTQATVLDETAQTLLVWGVSTEAVDAATEARSLLQRLAATEPKNVDYQHALELGDRQLGEVLRASGYLVDAFDAYSQALRIGEALAAKDTGNPQWQRDLFLTYASIGLVAIDQNNLPAALDAYEHAKAIAVHMKDFNVATADGDLAWVQGALDEVHRQMAEATPQK